MVAFEARLEAIKSDLRRELENARKIVELANELGCDLIAMGTLGEITAQHVYLGGGEVPEVKHVSGGLLGADYEIRSFGGIMSAFSGRVINTSDAITWQSVALGKKVTR